MRRMRLLATMLTVLGGWMTQAQADPVLVQAAGATRSVACNGGPAQVEGARNLIKFTGVCTGLQVRGDGNAISIPLSGQSLIDIEGGHNRVRYSSSAGIQPRLRVVGDGTEVLTSQNAPAPLASQASISGNDLNLELDCNGLDFTLNSVGSTISLRGRCQNVLLHGEANLVRADLASGASVTIQGNANTLLYQVPPGGNLPGGSVNGMGSLVAPDVGFATPLGVGVPPARLPVALLMRLLDGQVQAQGTMVHLPPAVFTPDGFSVAGDMQLRRLGGLILQAWPSGVHIIGHDPDPTRATQMATAISTYLVDHGVPGLAAQISSESGESSVDVWLMK